MTLTKAWRMFLKLTVVNNMLNYKNEAKYFYLDLTRLFTNSTPVASEQNHIQNRPLIVPALASRLLQRTSIRSHNTNTVQASHPIHIQVISPLSTNRVARPVSIHLTTTVSDMAEKRESVANKTIEPYTAQCTVSNLVAVGDHNFSIKVSY